MKAATAGASLASFAACVLVTPHAHAWLFIEHTSIGRAALSAPVLDPRQRETLDRAWRALQSLESTTATLADGALEPDSPVEREVHDEKMEFSKKLDLAMLAALAGDHSCSARDLDATLRADWLPVLIDTFASNYEAIRKTSYRSIGRTNLWHESHLQAQGIDSQYLFRTGGSHFVIPRQWLGSGTSQSTPEDLDHYARRAVQLGTPINAVGVYVAYHARALQAASAAGCGTDPCKDPAEARRSLFFEAVALHFLEDAFSAGHVAGGPRDTSRAARMGTHDQYCQDGLSVQSWQGTAYPAFGDAHLHVPDKTRTSYGVASSLAQLADVLRDPARNACSARSDDDALDVCAAPTMVGTETNCVRSMEGTLQWFPAPPLEPVPPPSFRNDIGIFLRFSAGVFGGIGATTAAPEGGPGRGSVVPTWGLEANGGLGFTLDGVTSGFSDAVVVLEGGVEGVAGQRAGWCFYCSNTQEPLDPRLGWDVRLRMPFEWVPGDFVLIAAAYLITQSPSVFTRLVHAADGGFYWRAERIRSLSPSMGWQIVAGREAQYTSYNLSRALLNAASPQAGNHTSYSWTFPAVDWIVTRHFAQHSGNEFRVSLSYRYEHSDLIDSHFAVLSLTSDSDAYLTGL